MKMVLTKKEERELDKDLALNDKDINALFKIWLEDYGEEIAISNLKLWLKILKLTDISFLKKPFNQDLNKEHRAFARKLRKEKCGCCGHKREDHNIGEDGQDCKKCDCSNFQRTMTWKELKQNRGLGIRQVCMPKLQLRKI